MKGLIKAEEVAQFALGVYLFSTLDYAWWWFLVLILLPDLSMIGYAINKKVGAWSYNLFHHKGLGILILIIGFSLSLNWLSLLGVILFAHSAMDRIFGYGLKYEEGFKFTHLGEIGK